MEIKFLKVFWEKEGDKIRNTVIRNELRVDKMKEKAVKRRLVWYGHIMCLPDDRIILKKDASEKT